MLAKALHRLVFLQGRGSNWSNCSRKQLPVVEITAVLVGDQSVRCDNSGSYDKTDDPALTWRNTGTGAEQRNTDSPTHFRLAFFSSFMEKITKNCLEIQHLSFCLHTNGGWEGVKRKAVIFLDIVKEIPVKISFFRHPSDGEQKW